MLMLNVLPSLNIIGDYLATLTKRLPWISVVYGHSSKQRSRRNWISTLAKEKADKEYDKFKERTKNELSPVEIHFLENFEREQKKLLGGKGSKQ